MSAIEETLETDLKEHKSSVSRSSASNTSILTGFLKLLSSVRLGIMLLIILGLLAFLGMIIMQQNIEGFDKYFADLAPSERLLYGSLGFFDIYHSWYYNLVILFLSLNIILASIER